VSQSGTIGSGGGGGTPITTINGNVGSVTGATITIEGGNNITTTGVGTVLTVAVTGTTNHAVQVGNSTGSLSSVPVGTTGQVLTGVTGGDPSFQTPGSNFKITTYVANNTWTIDPRTQYVKVYGWNGGGGGGSGRRGADMDAGGGAGAAGGGGFYYEAPAQNFPSPLVVTIGAGGAGGATQTVDDTNGNPGGSAGQTSLGNIAVMIPTVALGGTEGTANGGVGSYTGIFGGSSIGAGQGQLGAGSNGSNAQNGIGPSASFVSGRPGGGGAGADSGNIWQGGHGGGYVNYNNTVTFVLGGTGGIESGVINGTNGADWTTQYGFMLGGAGGGGGGGQSVGIAAGNGGNGGFPGGGGGGGAGSFDGTNSGAGGNGGAGMMIIVEMF
jgi:hypothetical protein